MNRFSPLSRNTMSLSGEKSSALELARGRLPFVAAFFALAWLLVAMRVFDLTIIQGGFLRTDERSALATAESEQEPVLRAHIVDRNGVLIATTLKTASLYADPKLVLDPDSVAGGLARIFPDLDERDLREKLKSNRRFVWISRNLTPEEQARVLELGEPGLNFRSEPRRIYPQGNLAAHIGGYTDIDGRGLAGIERSFDEVLSAGAEPVRLTLDVRLQYFLRREMAKAVHDFNAVGGAGLVMDVRNGEILAAVSLPDFDPHDPGTADDSARFNRITLGVYEAGSIFKIFSTAALLEFRSASMAQRFDAREPLKRGGHTISDYHAEKRILTLPEVFMYSSNIGSALMGEEVGTENLRDFYRDLGLFAAPDIGIRESGEPLVPYPWRDINTLTASYGHGIAVTPLQIIAAAATIVGSGTLVHPVLVFDETAAGSHNIARNAADLRIVKPQTAHRMRQLLRLVVTDGTGSNADVPGYQVGGKTGTADKIGPHGYDRNRRISSFLGVFPMSSPRYAVLIMIDEPKGNKTSFGYATGGWVAAPAVGNVIAAMGQLLGVPVVEQGEGPDELVASLLKHVHKEEKHLVSY
ncbi:MAG: penicillin-binding protein 2 [Alphaproteobacteria bacterium]|nr:penicillin-binding protein 2 [Alphaproteobacteria bacterium]